MSLLREGLVGGRWQATFVVQPPRQISVILSMPLSCVAGLLCWEKQSHSPQFTEHPTQSLPSQAQTLSPKWFFQSLYCDAPGCMLWLKQCHHAYFEQLKQEISASPENEDKRARQSSAKHVGLLCFYISQNLVWVRVGQTADWLEVE